MTKFLKLLTFSFLFTNIAFAQSTVLQNGPWVSGHVPVYNNRGSSQAVVIDSGPASGGLPGVGISELLLAAQGSGLPPYAGTGTGPFGTNFCDYDGPKSSAAGYHYLCLSPNADGGGLLTYGAAGLATPLPLFFVVNGVKYEFPFGGGGGIIGPGSSIIGDLACWGNSVGTLLTDCGSKPVGANPTAQVGTVAVNGVASTFMRSDAAPPLASGAALANIGSGNITNSFLQNSSILVSGQNCQLGGTCTIPITGLSPIANNSVVGNVSGTTSTPTPLNQTQLTSLINTFSTTASGAVPVSPGGTSMFLRADGTWSASGGGGTPGGSIFSIQYNGGGLLEGTGPGPIGYPLISQGAGFIPVFSQLTSAGMSPTTVTPGNYTSTNITVDSAGRITAAANGSGGGTFSATVGGQTVTNGSVTTNQGNGGKIQLSSGIATSGHCVQFDANGNTIDAGGTCTTGGGGGTVTSGIANNLAFYSTTGTTVSGLTNNTVNRQLTSQGASLPPTWEKVSTIYPQAACDNTTDDTTVIQNAINTGATATNPTIISLPAGLCKISAINLPSSTFPVSLVGQGPSTTILETTLTSSTGGAVTINCNYCSVTNLGVGQFTGTTPTNGFGIVLNNTFSSMLSNVNVDGTFNGIMVSGSVNTISQFTLGQQQALLGTKAIYYTGTESFGLNLVNGVMQGNGNTSLTGIYSDLNSNSLDTYNIAILELGTCISQNGTAPTSGGIHLHVSLACDHDQSGPMLNTGFEWQCVNCFFGSALAGNGLTIASTYLGQVQISNSSIFGNFQHGILINGGTDTIITGNSIALNGQETPGSFNGVTVGVGVSNFNISDNSFVNVTGPNINTEFCGVLVETGNSNFYNIIGNSGRSQTNALICDGGTGTNKSVALNQNGSGGGGGVSSVANSDGTLTISPTTGTVVASINNAHTNNWSALQNFSAGLNFTSSTGIDLGTAQIGAGGIGQVAISSNNLFLGNSSHSTLINTAAGALPVNSTTGSITSGHCVQFSGSAGVTTDSGTPCGSGGSAVTSVSGSGAGISVSPTTGSVVVANTGVTSNAAGAGISVSSATGSNVITNTGVTSLINSDGSLTITPTSGASVAKINTANSNSWTSTQFFPNIQVGSSTSNFGIFSVGGLEQITFSGNNLFLGAAGHNISITGSSTGNTPTDFLCLDSGNGLVFQTTACLVSSKRFKDDLGELNINATSEIMALKPIQFSYKPNENEHDINHTRPQIGLYAEDVAEVDSRLAVFEQDGTTPKSYRTEAVLGLTIKAFQELKVDNDNLHAELNQLKADNDNLRAAISKIIGNK